jgi:hypothetical protein
MAKLESSHNSEVEKSTVVHAENAQFGEKDAESQQSHEDEKVNHFYTVKYPTYANTIKMTFKKSMALVAMAFLWTGSQIPLYLYGAVPPYSKLPLQSRYHSSNTT